MSQHERALLLLATRRLIGAVSISISSVAAVNKVSKRPSFHLTCRFPPSCRSWSARPSTASPSPCGARTATPDLKEKSARRKNQSGKLSSILLPPSSPGQAVSTTSISVSHCRTPQGTHSLSLSARFPIQQVSEEEEEEREGEQ